MHALAVLAAQALHAMFDVLGALLLDQRFEAGLIVGDELVRELLRIDARFRAALAQQVEHAMARDAEQPRAYHGVAAEAARAMPHLIHRIDHDILRIAGSAELT